MKIGMKVLIAVSALLLALQPAFAASPQIQEVSGKTDYDKSYTFRVKGYDPDGDIIQAYVEYWWGKDPVRIRKPIYYDAGRKEVKEEVRIDAKEGWQPPGSLLNYQWFLKDKAGNVAAGPTKTLIYNDNRYAWKRIATKHFEIFYYADRKNAELVAQIAENNFSRVTGDIGYQFKDKTKVYIYANHDDYMKVGDASLRDWAGGSAYSGYNLFIIPASDDAGWLRQVVPHEFTHIAVDQKLGVYGYDTPVWFSEGIAMYEEDNPEAWDDNIQTVGDALKRGQLVHLTEMNDFTFRSDEEVSLIYSESYTVIKFLVDTYGRANFNLFMDNLAKGIPFDEAVQKVYHKNLEELDRAWQDFLHQRMPVVGISFNYFSALLYGGLAVLLIAGVILKRRRDRHQIADQEEQGGSFDA